MPLVKLLLRKGGVVSEERNKEGKTLLHLMAEQCMEASMAPLLNLLAEQVIHLLMVAGDIKKDFFVFMARYLVHLNAQHFVEKDILTMASGPFHEV